MNLYHRQMSFYVTVLTLMFSAVGQCVAALIMADPCPSRAFTHTHTHTHTHTLNRETSLLAETYCITVLF